MNNVGFAICFAMVCNIVFAQDTKQIWLPISISIPLSKALSLEFTEELRYITNPSEIDQVRSEIELSFDIHKNIELAGRYTLIYKHKKDGIQHRNRLTPSIAFKHKFGDWGFNLKSKYQLQYEQDGIIDHLDPPFETWRNKLTSKYDISNNLSTSVSAELFHEQINSEFTFAAYRLGASISFDIFKNASIAPEYIYEVEKLDETNHHIFACNLKYKL